LLTFFFAVGGCESNLGHEGGRGETEGPEDGSY
jgi:hypothetical protein